VSQSCRLVVARRRALVTPLRLRDRDHGCWSSRPRLWAPADAPLSGASSRRRRAVG